MTKISKVAASPAIVIVGAGAALANLLDLAEILVVIGCCLVQLALIEAPMLRSQMSGVWRG